PGRLTLPTPRSRASSRSRTASSTRAAIARVRRSHAAAAARHPAVVPHASATATPAPSSHSVPANPAATAHRRHRNEWFTRCLADGRRSRGRCWSPRSSRVRSPRFRPYRAPLLNAATLPCAAASRGARDAAMRPDARARSVPHRAGSELVHERRQRGLLLRGQPQLQDQVEELDGVLQREAATVVQVRRAVLDAAQGERLDRPDRRLASEPLDAQIVHLVVEVVGRRVAGRARALAEEDLLAADLLLGRLAPVKAPVGPELRRRWEV